MVRVAHRFGLRTRPLVRPSGASNVQQLTFLSIGRKLVLQMALGCLCDACSRDVQSLGLTIRDRNGRVTIYVADVGRAPANAQDEDYTHLARIVLGLDRRRVLGDQQGPRAYVHAFVESSRKIKIKLPEHDLLHRWSANAAEAFANFMRGPRQGETCWSLPIWERDVPSPLTD